MSYFRPNIDELEGYVPGFQPKDSDVIKLNTNENPYPPSPAVRKAFEEFDLDSLRRYPQPLADDFRNAAASVLNLSPDNIIATNGGDDLLTICIRAFCDPNRPLVYPGPTYSLYPVLARIQNCTALEVQYDEAGFYNEQELLSVNPSLVIICNPNAPTSLFIRPNRLAGLAEKLKGRAVLLIDEAYVDFAEASCLDLVREYENVILLRSMSKGYALAGLRFGFGLADAALVAGLRKVKDSYNTDALANTLATAVIQDQNWLRETVSKVKVERVRLTEALRTLDFDVPQSSTNFLLAKTTSLPADQVYELLAAKNIYVRYFDLPGLRDKLRITVGTPDQNNKLIEALKSIIGKRD